MNSRTGSRGIRQKLKTKKWVRWPSENSPRQRLRGKGKRKFEIIGASLMIVVEVFWCLIPKYHLICSDGEQYRQQLLLQERPWSPRKDVFWRPWGPSSCTTDTPFQDCCRNQKDAPRGTDAHLHADCWALMEVKTYSIPDYSCRPGSLTSTNCFPFCGRGPPPDFIRQGWPEVEG